MSCSEMHEFCSIPANFLHLFGQNRVIELYCKSHQGTIKSACQALPQIMLHAQMPSTHDSHHVNGCMQALDLHVSAECRRFEKLQASTSMSSDQADAHSQQAACPYDLTQRESSSQANGNSSSSATAAEGTLPEAARGSQSRSADDDSYDESSSVPEKVGHSFRVFRVFCLCWC